MNVAVGHLVVGPEQHGVVRCARHLAAAIGGPTVVVDNPLQLDGRVSAGVRRHHLHFADRLFGDTANVAAAQFISLVDGLVAPVGVTLHDIPQASDGHAFEARADAYRRVVGAASGVIVSSDHERSLLAAFLDPMPDVRVIPLAVDRPSRDAPRPPASDDVAVLGFIYPGKGHAEVIDAMASLGTDAGFLAIGMASAGHDDLVFDLHERGRRAGIEVTVTGFVADSDLDSILRSVAVPVACHRHLSASGSINSWIAAGRRPLVPHGRYIAEVEARSPGALWIHDDSTSGLRSAIDEALSNPDATWAADDVIPFPSTRHAAAMYADVFEEWSR